MQQVRGRSSLEQEKDDLHGGDDEHGLQGSVGAQFEAIGMQPHSGLVLERQPLLREQLGERSHDGGELEDGTCW